MKKKITDFIIIADFFLFLDHYGTISKAFKAMKNKEKNLKKFLKCFKIRFDFLKSFENIHVHRLLFYVPKVLSVI